MERLMKPKILLAAVALTTGCVSVTEQQREAREYRDVEWLAKFVEDREKCRSKGGHFVVYGGMKRIGRRATVNPGDTYTCRLTSAFR